MNNVKPKISFDDLEVAFSNKSDSEIRFSGFIFWLMSFPNLVKVLSKITLISVKIGLPVKPIIKATIFKQFCGGETMKECLTVLDKMKMNNVKAILDYSIEGKQVSSHFESTKEEILEGIKFASNNPNIPFACVKITGIGRYELLKKVSAAEQALSDEEKSEIKDIANRLNELCYASAKYDVPLYIDAEESWIQSAIDDLALHVMLKYNEKKAVVFNTFQMYRWDRLDYLKTLIHLFKEEGRILGIKLVRGAYMEKENKRALLYGYPSPIQTSKENTDKDYDNALRLIMENINSTELCAGTHNEASSILLAELMDEKGIDPSNGSIYFSQLYGMSDNISNNLAHRQYNVAKYLPYGPVKVTVPYLLRRAKENTSITGEVGKELNLIQQEKIRRKKRGN